MEVVATENESLQDVLARAAAFAADPSLDRTELKALVRMYGGDYYKKADVETLRRQLREAISEQVIEAYGSMWDRGVFGKLTRKSLTFAAAALWLKSRVADSVGVVQGLSSLIPHSELYGTAFTVLLASAVYYFGRDAMAHALREVYGISPKVAAAAIARVHAETKGSFKRSPDPHLYAEAFKTCGVLGEADCLHVQRLAGSCTWTDKRKKCEPSGRLTYRSRPKDWKKKAYGGHLLSVRRQIPHHHLGAEHIP